MTTGGLREIRLPDVDGLGEIRVTVWSGEGGQTFRFAIHDNADDEEPSQTIDVSADDMARLASGIAGTLRS